MTFNGRLHVNGDFTVMSIGTPHVYISETTVTGGVYRTNPGNGFGPRNNPHFWVSGVNTESACDALSGGEYLWNPTGQNRCYREMESFEDNPSKGSAWENFALTAWGGTVRDKAHGVPRLILPVTSTPVVQAGVDAEGHYPNGLRRPDGNVGPGDDGNAPTVANANWANAETRLLVEPPRMGDTLNILGQKLACKATIRILDGVWYVKDPADPDEDGCSWPGIPIWSDHPGCREIRVNTPSDSQNPDGTKTLFVGQSNLYGPLETNSCSTATPPVEKPRPQLFSYYETGANGDSCEWSLGNSSYNNCSNNGSGGGGGPDGRCIWNDGATNIPDGCHTTNGSTKSAASVVSYGLLQYDDDEDKAWRPGYWDYYEEKADNCDDDTPNYDHDKMEVLLYNEGLKNGPENLSDVDEMGLWEGQYNDSTSGTPVFFRRGQVANLIDGTRSGFLDPRAVNPFRNQDEGLSGDAVYRHQRGNILPMNFDVEAFRFALDQMASDPGELGARLQNLGYDFTQPEQAVIWIGSTWPNSDTVPVPDQWPQQGRTSAGCGNTAGADPVPYNPSSFPNTNRGNYYTQAFPVRNICSDDLADGNRVFDALDGAGNMFNGAGNEGGSSAKHCENSGDSASHACNIEWIKIPQCSISGAANPALGTVNAIRLINGADLNTTSGQSDGTDLVAGLTIASNLPVYVLGDFNSSSWDKGSNTPSAQWVPAMIAGDSVTWLSKDWNDRNSPWNLDYRDTKDEESSNSKAPYGRETEGDDTTQIYCMVAGDVPWGQETSPYEGQSGGLHNFPRFIERLNEEDHRFRFRGSLINGFRSVHQNQPFDCCDIYSPPIRDWGFDPNLSVTANQPPGAPTIFVHAVRSWVRD